MIIESPLPLPLHIVSDVHWPLRRDYENGRHFLAFLDSLADEGGTLILLGDIFDFWFEWREVVPAYWFDLFHRFRCLMEKGTKIWFVCGNHDFHPGSYLRDEVGLLISKEELTFSAGGKRFYLAHGDGLARRDKGYRLLKKVIRHPFSIWLYQNLLHPDWGITLARWTSYTSRRHRRIDKVSWAGEYFSYARSILETGYDHVVLGHLHYPELKEVGEKSYINCGDWLSYFSYARFDEKGLALRYWTPLPLPGAPIPGKP